MAKRTIPIFDTSVFSGNSTEIERLLEASLLTSVVLFELVATSVETNVLKKYERWRNLAIKNSQFLTPSADDWWETSKAVRRLYLRKDMQPSKLKTLRNDALIARLAVKNNGFVVTHDVDDFHMVRKVLPGLKIVAASRFFR